MEAGKTFFLFSILEVSILHYLQKRVAAADVTEVGDEKQTRNFLQSEKRTAFDCDPRNYRKGWSAAAVEPETTFDWSALKRSTVV